VKVLRPRIAEEQANLNGIQRPDIANALLQGFEGARVGVYREGDELLPILMRAAEEQRTDVASVKNLQIWSPAAQAMIPLRQVVLGFDTAFEDEIVMRKDRKRTLTVFCDPKRGPASLLFQRLRPQIEAIDLPTGYTLEWGGEYEDSAEAQAGLTAMLPVFFLVMVLVVIALFNALRQPLIIWLCVPLALIGVTGGLLLTGQPFGFMALLGFLSLSGMLIKNAIVLIDQINLEMKEDKAPFTAIVASPPRWA
jgi:multidrug efflux pump subunit AcrB